MDNDFAIRAVNLFKSYENRPSITKLIRAGIGRSLGRSNNGENVPDKQFPEHAFVLSNLNFQVNKGEALGIIIVAFVLYFLAAQATP